jgi:hypothetical protein
MPGSYAACIGINMISSSTSISVSNNTIYNLACSRIGTGYYPVVLGIGLDGGSATAKGTCSNNQIFSLTHSSTEAANPAAIIGIRTYNSYGIWTIANNAISINNGGNTNPICMYGIQDASDTCFIYYNTIKVGGAPSSGSANSCAVNFYGSSAATVKNNLLINVRSNSGASGKHYVILETTAPAPLISNYNDLYANGTNAFVGSHNNGTTIDTTLAQWTAATTLDSNSVSKNVTFVSATDLHLSGGSIGDLDLIGTPIGGVTTDIDGDIRDSNSPYMGADENTSSPLPVELVSFLAVAKAKEALLTWKTITETNCRGFEIERRRASTMAKDWESVAFISGAGTSNSPHEYSFTDMNLPYGRYCYRIRQIDLDGKCVYYESNEIEVGTVPKVFALMQNHPNPFNPTTIVEFALEEDGFVTLKVHDMLGREVMTLVNDYRLAGILHQATLNASRLSSGVYFYRLESKKNALVRKFLLLK